MLAIPVNVLFALAIAGLVSVPLPLTAGPEVSTSDLITPQQQAPGGGGSGGGSGGSDGGSGGLPANKFATATSEVALFCAELETEAGLADCDESIGQTAELFRGSLKTPTTHDLIVQVTTECALWTQTLVSDEEALGPTQSTVQATITIWPVIVPIGADALAAAAAAPAVVFCDRLQEYELKEEYTGDEDTPDQDNLTMRAYQATRSANAFNWILEDPSSVAGNNEFDVVIVGRMDASATPGEFELMPDEENFAYGGVGTRTLVVEPVKLFG